MSLLPGTLPADVRAAGDELERRWRSIFDFGGLSKAPEIVDLQNDWIAFLPQWKTETSVLIVDDPDDLASRLWSRAAGEWKAEQMAAKHGFKMNAGPVEVPLAKSGFLSHTKTYDEHGKVKTDDWSGVAAPVAKVLIPLVGSDEDKKTIDPNFAPKALAVGALGLGTVAAVVSMKSDGARAGVAVVGTLATVAAGWLAFGPTPRKAGA
jgi:hypothetical protein